MQKYALIDVDYTEGINSLARVLIQNQYIILSTGKSYEYLREELTGLELQKVLSFSDYTGFPEILSGSLNRFHPKLHAGITANQAQLLEIEGRGLSKIGIVVANIVPFTYKPKISRMERLSDIANIDVGREALIRSAAKNFPSTLIITEPEDYELVTERLEDFSFNDRRFFASEAFSKLAENSIAIARYFNDQTIRKYHPIHSAHIGANVYTIDNCESPLKVLHGYIDETNLVNALLGYQFVSEASAIIGKPVASRYHISLPICAALGSVLDINSAFSVMRALDARDNVKGGFICVSHPVDIETAKMLNVNNSFGVIAPSYTIEALTELICNGTDYPILTMSNPYPNDQYREICGIAINRDCSPPEISFPSNVPQEKRDELLLAYLALRDAYGFTVAYTHNSRLVCLSDDLESATSEIELAYYNLLQRSQTFKDYFTLASVEPVENISCCQAQYLLQPRDEKFNRKQAKRRGITVIEV